MRPPMRRIFFVDLDDTLYPERSFAISAFEEAGRWAEAELGAAVRRVQHQQLQQKEVRKNNLKTQ